MNTARTVLKFSFAAPLALALAACGGGADGELESDAIEAIAAPDGTNWGETVTVSDEDGYILGNPDAPLKLIEYASHTCGACANFSQTGKPSIKEYVATGVVSFEQRNLVRDPIDLTIATLVRCGADANVQALSDQAWGNFNEIMGAAQANGAQLEIANELPGDQRLGEFARITGLTEFFAARGLSRAQQSACLADVETIETIRTNSSTQAEELNILATPTFILNGRKLDVNQWRDLEPILQRAGARSE
ncbi:thioredoxin domain-containing protein [Erythrobacter sp. Alg231-14]|uniref:thioredoxin domain-containing protein n=1 Tax=Erythrobacter sp. Alg231-14 TaxID=1922225 RepID=UPI000D54B924